MKALVIHAHPDDELLFAGALMDARPGWDWTTVSLTGGLREKVYPGISLGFADEWRILSMAEYRQWRDAVAGLNLSADIVLTHNRMGEYGHPHHMSVHKLAHELFVPVWDFYLSTETTVGPQASAIYTSSIEADGRKRDRFVATYGIDVLAELWDDKPMMMNDLFSVEWFTGPGPLP